MAAAMHKSVDDVLVGKHSLICSFSSISAVAIRKDKPMFPSFNLAKDTGDSRVCHDMFNFLLNR